MKVQEPFDHGRAAIALVLALVVVGGIEAGKALRRMSARLKEPRS